MINTTDILAAWQRVGWIEPSKTGYTGILDTDNKTTLSTLVFDEYPLSNFVGVKDTYHDKDVSTLAINAFLKAWQQNSIVDICKDVFGDSVIESRILLNEVIDLDNTIDNSGKFVGWKIVIPKGFAVKLKSVGITLDTVASFNLYIFNASQKAAVGSTIPVTAVANSEKVTALTNVLYGSTATIKSGVYYIGYFQTDLGLKKAIQRNFYYKNSRCLFSPVIGTPVGVTLPDDISETGTSYGLNLEYSIHTDNTSDYLDNVSLFDRAIQYSVWSKVLNQYLLTTRKNWTESMAKEGITDSKIFAELNGFRNDELYEAGMKKKYLAEINSIKKNFNKKSTTVTLG